MMRSPKTLTIVAVALSFVATSCTSGGSKGKTLGHSQLIQTGPGESYKPTGKLVADMGFRPENNGFGFENYGEGPYENMVADDVRSLFGDGVCGFLNGDTCDLTPQAAQWMEQVNLNMAGGHCYGFSVASLLFYSKQQNPSDYGADHTPDIKLKGNTDIQRDIATTWSFQTLPDVVNAQVTGTPSEILDKLIDSLKPGADELYTIAIFQADGSGGHAITPYAIEDKGDGSFAVLVYDNNYPKVTRALLINRNDDTWGYNAATNPNEPSADYIGDATTKTLSLFPTSPALDQNLTCPFCEGGKTAFGAGPVFGHPADIEYNEVILTGDPTNHGHLLLTDKDDHKTGWVDGKYVNEIPGVQVYRPLMDLWDQAVEPIYDVPTTVEFEISIDGTDLEKPDMTSVSMIGPGYELAVEDINLDPGQVDTMAVAPDGKTLSYITKSAESPFIDAGIEGNAADYEFGAQGVDLTKGGQITVSIDTKDEILVLTTEGSGGAGKYSFGIRRVDDQGEEIFSHDDILLQPGESAGIAFGKWANNGAGVPLIISTKSGDKTITLTDEGDKAAE